MPRELVYEAVCRYLTPQEKVALDNDLQKVAYIKSDGRFCEYLLKHFDINRFKDGPVYEEDILLYNYFKYDYNGRRLVYKGLLVKYNQFLKKLEKQEKK